MGKEIFSDRPKRRISGDSDSTYASVESMVATPCPSSSFWLCALTIVHELSHKLVATEDKRYACQGLKPSASFPAATALINADSWAYFCGDILGAVPKSAVEEALS